MRAWLRLRLFVARETWRSYFTAIRSGMTPGEAKEFAVGLTDAWLKMARNGAEQATEQRTTEHDDA